MNPNPAIILADHDENSTPVPVGQFTTTQWSVVLLANQGGSTEAQRALEELCRSYWYPLYAFLRRQGLSPEDAQDLTQEFFSQLLQRNDLSRVSPDQGRFRSFLLASLKHLMLNEQKRAHRLKRGGGQVPISLDLERAASRYAQEPSHDLTPEKIYERRWALTILEKTLARLRDEYRGSDRLALFERLKDELAGEEKTRCYAQIGAELGMSEDAVKMAVCRLRKRYRGLLREEIAETVAHPNEVEDELRYLISALAG